MSTHTIRGQSEQFALDLVKCIRSNAERAADLAPTWRDACMTPMAKVDRQVEVLQETITAFEAKHGYQAALWCTCASSGTFEPARSFARALRATALETLQ